MRFALINPAWSFEGSIYFGCREPHLPVEYGYSKALLEARGHEVVVVDGQVEELTEAEIVDRVKAFGPIHRCDDCTILSVLALRAAGVADSAGAMPSSGVVAR